MWRAELATIFGRNQLAWPDGAPIRIILRPEGEADTALLGPYLLDGIARVAAGEDVGNALGVGIGLGRQDRGLMTGTGLRVKRAVETLS